MRVPGMLHGRVVRPATVNSKPVSVDESSIKDIPGVVKVVQDGNFVGVVANTEWSAIQAARKLKVTWSMPATKLAANQDEVWSYLKNTKGFRDQLSANKGNLDSAFAQASKTLKLLTAGPSNCTACSGLLAQSPTFKRRKPRFGPARKARSVRGRTWPKSLVFQRKVFAWFTAKGQAATAGSAQMMCR